LFVTIFVVQSGHRIILFQMMLSLREKYFQLIFSVKNAPFLSKTWHQTGTGPSVKNPAGGGI
jgi:hypothetical protein